MIRPRSRSLSFLLGLTLLGSLACATTPLRQSEQHTVSGRWPDDLKVHVVTGAGYRAVDHRVASYEDDAFYGVELDFYRPQDPFGIELGFSFATESFAIGGGDRDHEFYEGFVGLRRTFGAPEATLHPYVAAGASYLNEEINFNPQNPSADPRATGAGGYARAGAYWRVANIHFGGGEEVIFGLDARGVVGDDTDFVQAMVYLGVGN